MELNPLKYIYKEDKKDEKKLGAPFIIIVIVLMILFAGILSLLDSRKVKKEEIPVVNISMLGDTDNLISFSILSGEKVSGIKSYKGTVKGGYFFEGNILINILDSEKKKIRQSNAMATTDWMTSGPVEFEGKMDFTGFPKGPAYLEIRQDDPSGGESGLHEKFILVPIIIE